MSMWLAIAIGLVACAVLAWIYTHLTREEAEQPVLDNASFFETAWMHETRTPALAAMAASVPTMSETTPTRKAKVDPIILRKELTQDPARIGYSQLDYTQCANLLNMKPTLPNPEQQKTVSSPPDRADILSCLTPAEILKLYTMPTLLEDVAWSIHAGTRERDPLVSAFASMLGAGSKKSFESLLNQTQADPAYKEFIDGKSRAEELGLPFIKAADVQNALVG